MKATDPYTILEYPLSTEKAVREMESSNSLIFIVDKRANKTQIKWAAQKAFEVKVIDIQTQIQPDGKKKARIKLHPDSLAVDVTTKLGLV